MTVASLDLSPLGADRVSLKLFLAADSTPDPIALEAAFRRWVAEDWRPAEGWIDVVRYRHLAEGPSIMLVGTRSHLSLDSYDGERPGVRYARRRTYGGARVSRWRTAVETLREAIAVIEAQTPMRFDRTRLELAIEDRLLAPNTAETFVRVNAELRDLVRAVPALAGRVVAHECSEQRPFRVSIIQEPSA